MGYRVCSRPPDTGGHYKTRTVGVSHLQKGVHRASGSICHMVDTEAPLCGLSLGTGS